MKAPRGRSDSSGNGGGSLVSAGRGNGPEMTSLSICTAESSSPKTSSSSTAPPRIVSSERLLQTLLTTAPFFQRLTAEERTAIAERFRPRRFGRGAQILEEGAPGGGLYLILVGAVEVVRAGKGGGMVKLGTLGEGSYFGEMSLLRGGVASATVRTLRMTEAVQLPPRDFYELASQHPVLWEQLRSEAERRDLANHAILAGETRKSDTFYLV